MALARHLAGNMPPPAVLRVAGVDESAEMLAVARSRDGGPQWILGDIRALPVDGPFDLVISCFNTLQHLLADEDLSRALRETGRVIAPQGVFAFDIYRPNMSYLARPHRDHLARSITTRDGRELEVREDTNYDPDSRVLTIDWRLVEERSPASAPLATTRYQMRQYLPEELDRLLAISGFKVEERFGDLDRSAFTSNSKRQVVVCVPG
jgi:SAM-dependent methyltransferase